MHHDVVRINELIATHESRLLERVPKSEPLPYQVDLWPEYNTVPWPPPTFPNTAHSSLVSGPVYMVGFFLLQGAQALNFSRSGIQTVWPRRTRAVSCRSHPGGPQRPDPYKGTQEHTTMGTSDIISR